MLSEIKYKNIRDGLFLIVCLSLPFAFIPQLLQQNFIGGSAGNKLAFYPLVLMLAYAIYCQCHFGFFFKNIRVILLFFISFCLVLWVSTIYGLIVFPYYDDLLRDPRGQIAKFAYVYGFLKKLGMNVDEESLMQFWVAVRQIKNIPLEFIWTFGVSYLVYCFYKFEWNKGIKILCSGAWVSAVICILFSIVECCREFGILEAEQFIRFATPYFMEVNIGGEWWPPLLWKVGQIRMVFAEPSWVGNFIAFCLPFIWLTGVKTNTKLLKFATAVLTVVMSFFVFLTNARTAYAMIVGMLFLMFLLLIWTKGGRLFLKQCFLISVCVAMGFLTHIGYKDFKSDYFSRDCNDVVRVMKADSSFVEIGRAAVTDNLASLTSGDKRSNAARYGLISCYLRIARDRMWLGTGRGLAKAYAPYYFTKEEKQDYEISMWLKNQSRHGVLARGANSLPDALNEYVARLSQSGILGLIVFMIPFIWVILKLLVRLRRQAAEEDLLILLSLISLLVSGCNGSLSTFYCPWLVLGIAFAICYGKRENDEKCKNEKLVFY